MTINSPEDMLAQARVKDIFIANCATCRHSSPGGTYGNSDAHRICHAFGGRSCSSVNSKGDCVKYQAQEEPGSVVRLTVVANCTRCAHSREHPLYFKTQGTLLCDANGGDGAREHNNGGDCNLYEERSPSVMKALDKGITSDSGALKAMTAIVILSAAALLIFITSFFL